MSTTEIFSAIQKLTAAEQIELIGRVWDHLDESTGLTKPQQEELERRLEEDRAAPDESYSWDEVKNWILSNP